MKYVLKNKDRIVLEFEVKDIQSKFELDDNNPQKTITRKIISNIAILDSALLPKSIKLSNNDIAKSLKKFIEHRKAPSNRTFVKEILKTLNRDIKKDFMGYVDISFALSLNDSYWITPADKDYKWEKYNLYNNQFDKALELVAFNGASHTAQGITSSPEYTTSGALKKCWHRDNGQIYLYKGSSKDNAKEYKNSGYLCQEVFSEYYMAQIAETMGFNYVPYDLKEFHGKIVSTCPLFTNENEGYIPIHYLLNDNLDKDDSEKLSFEISKIYGKEAFEDLMLFDAIICNTDRHLGNFGMMIDNNTNEILRPAPIFDNGQSIIENITYDDLQSIKSISSQLVGSVIKYNFKEQIELFARHRHLDSLKKLVKFEFKKHEKFNLDDNFLESIQKCIRYRANMALEFAYQKDKKIQISKTRDIAKSKSKKPKSNENNGIGL